MLDPAAIVDFGQGDRLHPLFVVDAQRLHRPASNREIAVAIDPLEPDRVAQPIVARNVVAAQEGVVGREPDRSADTPVRIELIAARGIELAAKILFAVRWGGANMIVDAAADGARAGVPKSDTRTERRYVGEKGVGT